MSKAKKTAKEVLEEQTTAMITSLKTTIESIAPERMHRSVRGIIPQIEQIKLLKEAAEWM